MNYAFTEMNLGDEGRVITALPLRYLYLGDTWPSGKVSVFGTPSNLKLNYKISQLSPELR